MMKLIKTLFWIIALLVVITVGAVIAVTNLVDPNEYKPQIQSAVKSATGRDIQLDGNLELSFYPQIGINTGRISLANREGFGTNPMVALDEANIRVALMPLLKKTLEVDTVVLRNPTIRLSRQEDGTTNWGDLAAGDDSSTSESGGSDSAAEDGAGALAGLAIQGVSIEGGTVDYVDAQTGQNLNLDDLNLTTGKLVPGEPLDIALSVAFNGNVVPEPGTLQLSTTATVDPGFESVRLDTTRFSVTLDTMKAALQTGTLEAAINESSARLNNAQIDLTRNGIDTKVELPELAANWLSGQLSVPEFSLRQGEHEFSGGISALDLLGSPNANGSFNLKTGALQTLLADNGLDIALPGPTVDSISASGTFDFKGNVVDVAGIAVDASLNEQLTRLSMLRGNFDLESGALTMPQFSLQQGDAAIKIENLNGTGLLGAVSEMTVSGMLDITSDNVSDLLARNGFPDLVTEELVKMVSLSTELNLQNNAAAMNSLSAAIDDKTIEGFVVVDGLDAPGYRFDLQMNQLDVDKLVAALPASDSEPEPSTTEQILLPVASLQGLNVDGRVQLGLLRTSGLDLENIDVTVKSDQNVLTVSPIKASVMGGSVDSSVVYDVSSDVPTIETRHDIKGVDVGGLLAALGVTDSLEGRGSLSTDITTRGRNPDEAIKSLNGTVNVLMNDGAVKGYDLQAALSKIQNVLSAASGESTSTRKPNEKTKFAELSSSLAINNGVVRTQNLDMKAPLFRVNGAGLVDLPAEGIDFDLDVAIVGSLEGQGGASLEKLVGASVPLTIKGALADPKIALDVKKVLQKQATQKLTNKLLEQVAPAGTTLSIGSGSTEGTAEEAETEADPKEKLKKKLKSKLFKKLGID
ncbi:MAG: AsmA family protein [Pseudomonadota bacterium]